MGKRAKAFSQLRETWKLISENQNPVFASFVLSFVDKIGIFGWKDRQTTATGGAMNGFNAFTKIPGSTAGIITYKEYMFGENFNFVQVKYPHAYLW